MGDEEYRRLDMRLDLAPLADAMWDGKRPKPVLLYDNDGRSYYFYKGKERRFTFELCGEMLVCRNE